MEPDIDLAGVVETLQHENERLRLHILKMRTAYNPMEAINPDRIRTFLMKNYLLILVGFMALMASISFFDVFVKLSNNKRSQTSER